MFSFEEDLGLGSTGITSAETAALAKSAQAYVVKPQPMKRKTKTGLFIFM